MKKPVQFSLTVGVYYILILKIRDLKRFYSGTLNSLFPLFILISAFLFLRELILSFSQNIICRASLKYKPQVTAWGLMLLHRNIGFVIMELMCNSPAPLPHSNQYLMLQRYVVLSPDSSPQFWNINNQKEEKVLSVSSFNQLMPWNMTLHWYYCNNMSRNIFISSETI